MTHLNIQQGQNIEVVSTNLIKKLYEAALSVPEPLEGEQDAAYMSGNLQVNKSYRTQVEYLTNRFDDLHINITASYYIEFEDPEVLRILLANNIGADGIGITEAEASNITIDLTNNTNAPFFENKSVTKFNELNLFADNVISGETFQGNTKLTSIGLQNMININPFSFRQCTNLNIEVNCPHLAYLGHQTFQDSGITKILNLGTITTVGDSAFSNCLNLTEVHLPSTVTRLGGGAFDNCPLLQSINVDNLLYIGTGSIGNSPSLTDVLYFKELLSLYENNESNGLFENGSQYIYSPKLQYLVGGFDQGGNNVRGAFVRGGWNNTRSPKKIVYFKNLSTVETGAFCGSTVKHIIINNTTPPTVTAYIRQKQDLLIDVSGGGVSSSVVYNVWVPDSAISAYQQHQYWGEFGNKIQGLSGMNKVATKELWDQLSDSAKEDTLIEEYM